MTTNSRADAELIQCTEVTWSAYFIHFQRLRSKVTKTTVIRLTPHCHDNRLPLPRSGRRTTPSLAISTLSTELRARVLDTNQDRPTGHKPAFYQSRHQPIPSDITYVTLTIFRTKNVTIPGVQLVILLLLLQSHSRDRLHLKCPETISYYKEV